MEVQMKGGWRSGRWSLIWDCIKHQRLCQYYLMFFPLGFATQVTLHLFHYFWSNEIKAASLSSSLQLLIFWDYFKMPQGHHLCYKQTRVQMKYCSELIFQYKHDILLDWSGMNVNSLCTFNQFLYSLALSQ